MALPRREEIERSVLLAASFTDPFTGLAVTDDLIVTADRLDPPYSTRNGRFVWFKRHAVPTQTALSWTSRTGAYYPGQDANVPLPANPLERKTTLKTTGSYRPPEGATGIAGRLVDPNAIAIADADVTLEFELADQGGYFASTYKATTDKNGGFVALLAGIEGDAGAVPAAGTSPSSGRFWLRIAAPGGARFTDIQSITLSRVTPLGTLPLPQRSQRPV